MSLHLTVNSTAVNFPLFGQKNPIKITNNKKNFDFVELTRKYYQDSSRFIEKYDLYASTNIVIMIIYVAYIFLQR